MDTQQSNPAPAPTPTSHSDNNLLAILSYLSILVFIPYILAKDDPFVKFHVKQGLVLFIIEAIIMVVGMGYWGPLWMVFKIINLGTLILSIIGIINVVQNKQKELPLVGHYANKINI